MAHNNDKNKQIHYVGDSRVPVRSEEEKMVPLDYDEFPGKTEAFLPDFLLKEWMVGVVFFAGFMALVMAHEPPLGEIADPTNTSFLPVPDWYFLFLYELLKFTWASGPYTVIGILVIPGVMFGALLLAPWLDASKERRPFKRPITTSLMVLTLIGVVLLTWFSDAEHREMLAAQGGYQQEVGEKLPAVSATDHPGYEIYKENACIQCHGEQLEGVNGPSLIDVGNRYSEEELLDITNNGKGTMPQGMFQGSEEEKALMIEWLEMQKVPGSKDAGSEKKGH
ncbi:menaquinol-cytochrome c reductase cytochrome b/c subunit [Mechercharimyces sp. CAU 1602]|uniref:menaquinol-cytochrome c reductase cytochrome b/c subunit n=1 Tax=Mechercharimyces sp. CAU 1602 TaxID=2973933 RepID=UPI00216217FF|nr:menaquinol-cytochrome c reductase cytochrome b/c subunit [Mechercharimyces sp. CAU 1602]MCS1351003.1 c-type cytochrome [Mechercharimyces sp. CAU 1602]